MQLRGRVSDDLQRAAAESYAKSQFGVASVYAATRLDADLPGGWPTRVLVGLEALGHLANGAVVVQPDVVDVRGNTGDPEASATISRILAEKLGASQNYQVNVTYLKKLDPKLGLPSPPECVASINEVLRASKITFAPGSANIEASAGDTLDQIAGLLGKCEDVRMEISGHTDSQGRSEMNRSLSQSRAQAVLTALLSRRVLTSNLSAKGYGEDDPIADNGTEDGREANRRIEFRLLDLPAANEPASVATGAGGAKAAPPAAPELTDAATGATSEATEDTAGNGEAANTSAAPVAPQTEAAAPGPDAENSGAADPTEGASQGDYSGPAAIVQTPSVNDPRPALRPETAQPTDQSADQPAAQPTAEADADAVESSTQ